MPASSGLTYTLDLFGNPTGGIRNSFISEGVLTPTLDTDLGKFTKLDGANPRAQRPCPCDGTTR
jgi:hypothetical protein